MPRRSPPARALEHFHECSQEWFLGTFEAPTRAQALAWPTLVAGGSALLVAPTGSGKTLAAFFSSLDRLLFLPPSGEPGVRVLYISPLKALASDVERNLRAPLVGMSAVAARCGVVCQTPRVGVRSGDTSSADRERMRRRPPDVLITTPESLYLLLTSRAREMLRSVETVIVDEIHALVDSKRGAHLFLSLERIEELRRSRAFSLGQPVSPLQRIGLSATQRPLEEVARLLGGNDVQGQEVRPRPVTIVDAGEKKELRLSVEVPTADMAGFSDSLEWPGADDAPGLGRSSDGSAKSIWPAVVPRLVEHIRSHRSTIVFVNSRGSAERLAGAINEEAEEEIARAHHGSLAHDARADIEDQLKAGRLPAIVATASLELGIDMGSVDLVVLVESPPSVASGMQRVGRARHHVGGIPEGVTFPKYRSDLIACAAVTRAMLDGNIESTRYPRNPLDVLAQQIVAMVAMEPWKIEELFDRVRGAAPFSELSRGSFEGVLDMLSGRYPSEDFSELRARITWDRIKGELTARRGAGRVALINGGTIPDRGLYGVFLAGAEEGRPKRVGELDEEMVFESRVGEVFLLGASSWRVEEITHDRVLVSPAPGEPGRMPFWHGDRRGRPLEFGLEMGRFVRQVAKMSQQRALEHLRNQHCLDENAANNLLTYLAEQKEQSALPTDRQVVVERFLDEIGDHRICILSPFGSRVHAPWAMAVRAHLVDALGLEVDVTWSDDGIVVRLSEGDRVPPLRDFLPEPDEVEERIVSRLAETSLFSARFRENAGRALLLTKKRPGGRTPLWALRRRSATLLGVAARFRDFPIVLETYRECLQDHFDLPGLRTVLEQIASRKIRVLEREADGPSPFAAALLFDFVAQFMYEGDAPLAERRAQALTIDSARLRELLGDAALRTLLDPAVVEEVAASLQKHGDPPRDEDDVHDLLLGLGPQSEASLRARFTSNEAATSMLRTLLEARRIISVRLGGEVTLAAVEDAARLRDGLGVALPAGLPVAFLEPRPDGFLDLVLRHAATHVPFTSASLAARFQAPLEQVESCLRQWESRGRVTRGEFLPGESGIEWCEVDVLRRLKRASLARLRGQVQAVSPEVLSRFSLSWHQMEGHLLPVRGDVPERRSIDFVPGGPDAVLEVVERLEGAPLPAATLESEILPARLASYLPTDLDTLCAAGDVVWQGVRSTGPGDGRIALYTAAHFPLLARRATPLEGQHYDAIRAQLASGGGLFFRDLSGKLGGFPPDLLEALWDLVWNGEVSNDTLTPLRRLHRRHESSAERRRRGRSPRRTRRPGLPGSEGRFWLVAPRLEWAEDDLEQRMLWARALLLRHGVLTRESLDAEEIDGGFSRVYPLLKALEERGQVRRGYFVEGLGATQFAEGGAEDALRHHRREPDPSSVVCLAATDPANLHGSVIRWPDTLSGRAERAPGARVVLLDGRLVGFLSRSQKHLSTALSEDPAARRLEWKALARGLAAVLREPVRSFLQIETIDGEPAMDCAGRDAFEEEGFRASASGLLLHQPREERRGRRDGALDAPRGP